MHLEEKTIFPMTLIYVKRGDEVLLLRRHGDKKMLPNVWLGLGGKIEKGETVEDSVRREVREESGLLCEQIHFRGTLSYIRDTAVAGTIYLFVVDEFSGTLLPESEEGILAWHTIISLPTLEYFAPHQHHFVHKLLVDDNYFYTGISYNSGSVEMSYNDSESFFKIRG